MSFAPSKPALRRQRRQRQRDLVKHPHPVDPYRTISGRRPLGVLEDDHTLPPANRAGFNLLDQAFAYLQPVQGPNLTPGTRFEPLGARTLSYTHIQKTNQAMFSPGPMYLLPSTLAAAPSPALPPQPEMVRTSRDPVTSRYHMYPRSHMPLFPAALWSDGGRITRLKVPKKTAIRNPAFPYANAVNTSLSFTTPSIPSSQPVFAAPLSSQPASVQQQEGALSPSASFGDSSTEPAAPLADTLMSIAPTAAATAAPPRDKRAMSLVHHYVDPHTFNMEKTAKPVSKLMAIPQ